MHSSNQPEEGTGREKLRRVPSFISAGHILRARLVNPQVVAVRAIDGYHRESWRLESICCFGKERLVGTGGWLLWTWTDDSTNGYSIRS